MLYTDLKSLVYAVIKFDELSIKMDNGLRRNWKLTKPCQQNTHNRDQFHLHTYATLHVRVLQCLVSIGIFSTMNL